MFIKVTTTNTQKEFDKVMNELNDRASKIYDRAYLHYSEMAKGENENVFMIFDDWWHGKCVSTKEYEEKYSKEDNYTAGSIILSAISMGFG